MVILRNRSGSALLLVTLFGTLILLTALGLVAVTSRFNRESYALNRQIVCRYAAEAALQDAMHRISREAAQDQEGWFAAARTQPDPVLTETVSAPSGSNCSDTPTVRLSILDSTEALSRLGANLGSDQYIVEARATLDRFASIMHMRVNYQVTPVGSSGTDPATLFSRYLLWTTNQTYPSSYPFSTPPTDDLSLQGRWAGYIHFEGDALLPKSAVSALPITVSGRICYPNPGGLPMASGTDENRTFDYDLDQLLETAPRPEFLNMSEADAKSQSGTVAPVRQPDYGDVESRFLSAAMSQGSSNPSLGYLWIDPANPLYAPGGAMDVGALTSCTVQLSHDNSARRTSALIRVFGSSAPLGRSATVVLPSTQPVVLLSRTRIASLKGKYYANLTVASTYCGSPSTISQYGPYNDPPYNAPKMQVLGAPAVTITDHLINVDQDGRPKFWMYTNNAMYRAPSRLGLTGVPVSDVAGENVDSYTGGWIYSYPGTSLWDLKKNPAYAAAQPSVLGIYSRGDTMIRPDMQNIISMWAYYGGHPSSRIYVDPAVQKSNSAHAGSTVTPLRPAYTYIYQSSGNPTYKAGMNSMTVNRYDWDLMTTPPPYWMAPASSQASSNVQITATFGSIYLSNR
jgi:Tfp pilus assembly protein PilX